MKNYRTQKTLLALLVSMNSYNLACAAPIAPGAGNEVRTGVNEVISESVTSDEAITFQLRPDFAAAGADSGSVQIGTGNSLVIENTNNNLDPVIHGAVVVVPVAARPFVLNIGRGTVIRSSGLNMHGLLLGSDSDANVSAVNIGNSVIKGEINTPQASGIYLSGNIEGTLTISETASVSGGKAIFINGDASDLELIVKGRLQGQQAIDWENAVGNLRVTVSGGNIDGAITEGNQVDYGLVTVTGSNNHFRGTVETEYFHVEKNATAHIYDTIGPVNNPGAIVVEGDLIIEAADQVATWGTLVLSPDSVITIKNIRTGAQTPSISHDGDIQLRYGTTSDLWADLASQNVDYADADDPNEANYKYNITLASENSQLFTSQADVTANLIEVDGGGWDLTNANVNISGLYTLGAPRQDGDMLVVDIHPQSPTELTTMVRTAGAGESQQKLVSAFFADAIANPVGASSALATANEISGASDLAALAAELTPDSQSQQVARNVQNTFVDQISGRLTAISHNTAAYTAFSYGYAPRNDWSLVKVSQYPQTSQTGWQGISAFTSSGNLVDSRRDSSFWLKPFYSRSSQDTTRNSAGDKLKGYKAYVKGISGGLDRQLGDNLTLGFAASYADTRADKHNSSDKIDITTHQLGFYALWERNDWFVDSILNAGRSKNKVNRYIDGFSAAPIRSEFTSHFYGLNISAGKHIDFRGYKISPMLGFNYARFDTPSYTEKDPGATGVAMEVKKSTYERVEFGGGATISHTVKVGNGRVEPAVSLSGWYDAKGQQAKTESRFLFGTRFFTTEGADPERKYAQFALDLSYQHDRLEHLDLMVGYQRQQSSSAHTDSVYMKMKYLF